jgi:signal transduction histidine kinase
LNLAQPGHAAAIWLGEPDSPVQFVLAHSMPSRTDTDFGLAQLPKLTLEQSGFGPCWMDGIVVHDTGDSRLTQELLGQGAGATLALPLRSGDQSFGILQSVSQAGVEFDDDQVELLAWLADLLGPAMRNARQLGQLRTAYEELSFKQAELLKTEKLRALGELAGGMAHHFNNSLCGVLGYLQLGLQEQGTPPTLSGFLQSARSCALNAAGIMRRIQEFARQERQELTLRLLDINKLVRQTVEAQRPRWDSLGSPLVVVIDTEASAWVRACASELREALVHVTTNAIQAMPRGGTLTLRTWNEGEQVCLAVEDTGSGMTPEVQARLFEPFFTTRADGRSKGLGLSVVYGIVRRHDGSISIDSAPGRGTRCVIGLPVAQNVAVV